MINSGEGGSAKGPYTLHILHVRRWRKTATLLCNLGRGCVVPEICFDKFIFRCLRRIMSFLYSGTSRSKVGLGPETTWIGNGERVRNIMWGIFADGWQIRTGQKYCPVSLCAFQKATETGVSWRIFEPERRPNGP